jgi:hypothetical protein
MPDDPPTAPAQDLYFDLQDQLRVFNPAACEIHDDFEPLWLTEKPRPGYGQQVVFLRLPGPDGIWVAADVMKGRYVDAAVSRSDWMQESTIRWGQVRLGNVVSYFDARRRTLPPSLIADIEAAAPPPPPPREEVPPPALPEGTEAPGPAATAPGTAPPSIQPLPRTEQALALEFRRSGKATEAALVEFMTGKSSATALEVGRNVHDDETASEKTIRANCHRTSEDAESLGSPYRYRLSAGVVFKTL